MNIDCFFYEHPVFTYREFEKWKAKKGAIKDISLHTALLYYVKKGKLLHLRRALYVVLPPNATPETVQIDPYLIAGKAVEDSILAYHTALELHGVAYSSFEQFTFITQHKVKPFQLANQKYQPIAIPSILLKNKQNSFGVEVINRQGVDIKITNSARTFVDVLDRIELAGGIEEVYRSLENMVILNIDEIIHYCLMLKNARLAAKVGYFLEERKGAFAITDKKLRPLLAAKPKVPQYLSKGIQTNCCLVKKWNLMLPKSLLNRDWEEPNAEV
jgi:predicted transcriptional regulator of viral defense system